MPARKSRVPGSAAAYCRECCHHALGKLLRPVSKKTALVAPRALNAPHLCRFGLTCRTAEFPASVSSTCWSSPCAVDHSREWRMRSRMSCWSGGLRLWATVFITSVLKYNIIPPDVVFVILAMIADAIRFVSASFWALGSAGRGAAAVFPLNTHELPAPHQDDHTPFGVLHARRPVDRPHGGRPRPIARSGARRSLCF